MRYNYLSNTLQWDIKFDGYPPKNDFPELEKELVELLRKYKIINIHRACSPPFQQDETYCSPPFQRDETC